MTGLWGNSGGMTWSRQGLFAFVAALIAGTGCYLLAAAGSPAPVLAGWTAGAVFVAGLTVLERPHR